LRYVFESANEVKFYFDESDKIYDAVTGKIVKDKISILSINQKPATEQDAGLENFTKDFDWAITNTYRDPLGYITSKKVEVDFFDSDDDGISDDEELFEEIVKPNNLSLTKYVFFKKTLSINGVETFVYTSNNDLNIIVRTSLTDIGPLSQYQNNQILYFVAEDIFQIFNKSNNLLTITTDYKAALGRDKLQFRYIHAADEDNRIDPSISNIIDVYVLTREYDLAFREYLNNVKSTKPLPLSSDTLFLNYGGPLEKIKSLTDEIIYHPAKYRIIFGEKADAALQAKIKIIKNADIYTNDNDIKASVIQYINQFFSLNNWDFGDTFYMSEMAAYIMQEMSPNIVSILLVPLQANQSFGSLYEIRAEDDEILVSGATVNDIEIIDEITAEEIKSTGAVLTSVTSSTTGIQST